MIHQILLASFLGSVKPQSSCITGSSIGPCEWDHFRTILATQSDIYQQCRTIYSSVVCGHCSTTATLKGSCSNSLITTIYKTKTAFNGGLPCSSPTSVVEKCADCVYSPVTGSCDGKSRIVNYKTTNPVNGGAYCTPTSTTEICQNCQTITSTGTCDGTKIQASYKTTGIAINGGSCIEPTPTALSCADGKVTSSVGNCINDLHLTAYYYAPPVNGGKNCTLPLPSDVTQSCRNCRTTSTKFDTCYNDIAKVTYLTTPAAGGQDCTSKGPASLPCHNCQTTATVLGKCVSSYRQVQYFTDQAVNGAPCYGPTSTIQPCADCQTTAISGACNANMHRTVTFQTIAPINGGKECSGPTPSVVVQDCKACSKYANDCCFVVEMWKNFGKNTGLSEEDPSDCCYGDIPGIKCFKKKVIKLNWESNNLTGPIPEQMSKLESLRTLKLGHNNLNGIIPPGLSNLINLENLHLNDNNFTGSVDSKILSLPLLSSLKLNKNHYLTGDIIVRDDVDADIRGTSAKYKSMNEKDRTAQYLCQAVKNGRSNILKTNQKAKKKILYDIKKPQTDTNQQVTNKVNEAVAYQSQNQANDTKVNESLAYQKVVNQTQVNETVAYQKVANQTQSNLLVTNNDFIALKKKLLEYIAQNPDRNIPLLVRASFHDLFLNDKATLQGCLANADFLADIENAGLDTTIKNLQNIVRTNFPTTGFTFGDVIAFSGKIAVESAYPCMKIPFKFNRSPCLKDVRNRANKPPSALLNTIDQLGPMFEYLGGKITYQDLAILVAGAHGIKGARAGPSQWFGVFSPLVSSGKEYIKTTFKETWRYIAGLQTLAEFFTGGTFDHLNSLIRLPSDMIFYPSKVPDGSKKDTSPEAAAIESKLREFTNQNRSVFDKEFERAYGKLLAIGNANQDFVDDHCTQVCPEITIPSSTSVSTTVHLSTSPSATVSLYPTTSNQTQVNQAVENQLAQINEDDTLLELLDGQQRIGIE